MTKRRTHKRKFRKSRKNRARRNYPSFKRGRARGPSPISPNANIPCCMCEQTFPRDTTMVPSACLMKHGDKAHRICQECWWDPETGFAREDAPHGCPGCKKGLPLNPPLKSKKPAIEEIVVISDD